MDSFDSKSASKGEICFMELLIYFYILCNMKREPWSSLELLVET